MFSLVQDSGLIHWWPIYKYESDWLGVWICLISMAVATLICCILAILVLRIFRYRKLKFEFRDLHWTERARRLYPLVVFIAGTVNMCIYLQVLEAYLYFGNIPGYNWKLWASLIFLGGVMGLGFIFQLTEFPDKRKRTFQERYCDFVQIQAIFGSLLYLALLADIFMALTSNLALHMGIFLVAMGAMLSVHYGSLVWLIRVTGFTMPTEAEFDTACAELANRLGLKYRPTIVVAKWSFINALALPLAGTVLIPSELFRVMKIPEILAVVAHEIGHLRETFWQRFRRIMQSTLSLLFLTSPFWFEDLGIIFYPPTPKNFVGTDSITVSLSDLLSSLFAIVALVFDAVSLCVLIWSWYSKGADEKMGSRTLRWAFFVSLSLINVWSILIFIWSREVYGSVGNSNHEFQLLGGLTALFTSVVAFSSARIKKSVSIRMEEAADKAGVEGEQSPGLYARALAKLYEANLIPAVSGQTPRTHPNLYDRLVAAGITPDFPRPALPKMGLARLGILGMLVLHLLLFGIASAILWTEVAIFYR